MNNEAEMFEKAEKINASDYSGPVFVENGPASRTMTTDGDGDYHESVTALLDACRDDGVEPPAFAWACTRDVPHTSADDVIKQALEEHYDGAGDALTPEHIDNLQEFLNRWWNESGVVTFRRDDQLAVVIDAQKGGAQ